MSERLDAQTGVYATLDELVALRQQASGFSFLPRQPVRSLLTGHHTSRMRGRGLQFEELRAYVPGDDVTMMDWKVTARTRRPHVRIFTEERDHPILLVVDQRVPMFFGSRDAMKSTVAARLAALCAWNVLEDGDRVGTFVFNDTARRVHRPHRSARRVIEALGSIVQQNQALRVGEELRPNADALNDAIEAAMQAVPHDGMLCVISDFYGANGRTRELMLRAAKHNDVVAVVVYDPLETQLPDAGKFTVSNGHLHIEFDGGDTRVGQLFEDDFRKRMEQGRQLLARLGVPVLPISTEGDTAAQLRALLGVPTRPHRG